MSITREEFFRDVQNMQNRFEQAHSLTVLEQELCAFAEKYNGYPMGDFLMRIGEVYIQRGDAATGMVFFHIVNERFTPVNNHTLLHLRMAQYHFERGEEEAGVDHLITLCSRIDNYEESIEANGLTPLWEQYKHLVAGKVPPSLAFHTVKALPPENCAMQIGEILASGEDLLENLSAHLGELSAGGECLNCLNQWERTAFYADELCMEVNSGGFGGYLYSHGRHFEKAKQALQTIGAARTLALLEGIQGKFPRKKVPKDLERLQDVLDKMEDKGVDFEAEDECFYESAEKELLQKLREYAIRHGSSFR